MTHRWVAVLLILGLALPLSGGAAAADAAAWYNSAWKYRQKITVNHEQVAGSVDGFPMLVKLTGTVFDKAQSDGNDILFTAADGTTKLLHEIESMDGEVVAWVQMPNLSEIEDTVLYVYYGNPTAENQQQPTNVWGNGFGGVWHLNDNPGAMQQDATSNNNDGTPVNIDSQDAKGEGKIASAVEYDGRDDRLSIPDSDNIDFATAQDFSVGFWVKFGSGNAANDAIVEKWSQSGGYPYVFRLVGVNSVNFIRYDGTNVSLLEGTADVSSGWHHVVGTLNAVTDRMTLYVDGANAGTATDITSGTTTNTSPLCIAQRCTISGTSFAGEVDELRISNVARSGAWIKTEYNNQSGRENFLTIAEPETQSTSTTAASSTSSLSSPLIQAINRLFNLAFDRFPTFTEWKYWADRVLAGEKDSFPELLGAMQWQSLFGSGSGAVQVATTSGPTVEIRNGTNRSGLAGRTLTRLSDAGYAVTTVGNAQDYNREQSKVYVLNHDAYDRAAELGEFLQVPVGLDLPAGERSTNADILVVLGSDFAE